MDDLRARIRRIPPRLLLPHVPLDAAPPERLDLLAAQPLPTPGAPAQLCLLSDPDAGVHVVALVHDADLVRPARSGDRVAHAVVRLFAGDAVEAPFVARRVCAQRRELDDVEDVLDADEGRETIAVGADLVLVVERRPDTCDRPPLDVLAHAVEGGFGSFSAADCGDLVAADVDRWIGPIVRLVRRDDDVSRLWDELVGALLGDARRGQGPEQAIRLATSLGWVLAEWHIAGASASSLATSPVTTATNATIAGWRRAAADAVASAAVLAESGSVRRLRGGRERLRDAFAAVERAHGTPVLPGRPLEGLAAFGVDRHGQVVLRPDRVSPSPDGHPPAQDVAAVLRGFARLAWTTHRRLVVAGEPVPAEQIGDWEDGMRQTVIESYIAALQHEALTDLFDASLLTAFEIQAECEALVRSARTGAGSTAVSDTALSALLGG